MWAQVTLHPAAVSLAACSYSVARLAAPGGGASAAPRCRAGEPVLLAVETRDRYGNASAVAPGAIVAAANGPRGAVPFVPHEARAPITPEGPGTSFSWRVPSFKAQAGAPPRARVGLLMRSARAQGAKAGAGVQQLRALLTAAGRHALAVSLTDPDPASKGFAPVPSRGAPAAVTVVPGPAAGRRTAGRDLPRRITAGVAAEFMVVPTDAYGNAGAPGGAFAAELAPAAGGDAAAPCAIEETASGGARPLPDGPCLGRGRPRTPDALCSLNGVTFTMSCIS